MIKVTAKIENEEPQIKDKERFFGIRDKSNPQAFTYYYAIGIQ